jgi:hypothetical protein
VTVDMLAGAQYLQQCRPTAHGADGTRFGLEDGRRFPVGHEALADQVDNGSVWVNGSGTVGKKRIYVFSLFIFYEHKSQNKI